MWWYVIIFQESYQADAPEKSLFQKSIPEGWATRSWPRSSSKEPKPMAPMGMGLSSHWSFGGLPAGPVQAEQSYGSRCETTIFHLL